MLPIVCLAAIILFVNAIILDGEWRGRKFSEPLMPTTLHDLSLPAALMIPAFVIIAIANIVMFLRSIPTVYIDLLRGKKARIEFKPEPYTIPESGKYFIATGIAILPYLEVCYEEYVGLDYDCNCYFEITPSANIPLGFTTILESSNS